MALLGNNSAVRNMGFGWVSYGIFWSDEETSQGQYSWLSGANNVDNIADAARTANVNVLIRISRTPEWARASDCTSNWDTCPPEDPDDFGTFAGALAQRVRSRLTGQQVAYEIWNEPNVSNEWGDMCPDPARYTELLRAAYPRIKARDASATVAGGAITTVAEIRKSCHIDDLLFIQGMYNAGAAPYFDVLADHPYGFISAPEADPVTGQSGLVFRRAERHRAYMVANGDAHKKIWATELGWAINPATEGYNCPAQEVQWYQVFNQQQQADYLVRAHQWARSYWPWMGAMFTWNFDFDEAPWYPECNSFRFYGVKNRLARPALQSFVQNPPPTYTPVVGTPLPTATPSPSATPVDGPPVITSVRYNRVNFTRDGGPLTIDLDARDSGPAAIDTVHVLVTYPDSNTQLLNMTLVSGTVYSGTWHLDFNIPANHGPIAPDLHDVALRGRGLPAPQDDDGPQPANPPRQHPLLGRANRLLGLQLHRIAGECRGYRRLQRWLIPARQQRHPRPAIQDSGAGLRLPTAKSAKLPLPGRGPRLHLLPVRRDGGGPEPGKRLQLRRRGRAVRAATQQALFPPQ